MIRLEGVAKRFGTIEALCPMDLEIRSGEWLGLFGHNGSGKTTLIRILLGLTKPSSGRLLLDGEAPTDELWFAFRRRLGFMPEGIIFYEGMSGEENLKYLARLRGADPQTVLPCLEQVGLAAAARRRVGEYSKGMQQRLNLAQALVGRPEILILDEPIEGLDPQGVRDFFDLLRSGSIRTVVLTSHRLAEVCNRVDRLCFLNRGRVTALGSVEEMRQKLQAPVRIHIFPKESLNGNLEAALDRLGAISVIKEKESLSVEVRQSDKLAFLTGLKICRDLIDHLHIEEPGLEDIYFETE